MMIEAASFRLLGTGRFSFYTLIFPTFPKIPAGIPSLGLTFAFVFYNPLFNNLMTYLVSSIRLSFLFSAA